MFGEIKVQQVVAYFLTKIYALVKKKKGHLVNSNYNNAFLAIMYNCVRQFTTRTIA